MTNHQRYDSRAIEIGDEIFYLATFGSRFLATLIDWAILIMILIAVSLPVTYADLDDTSSNIIAFIVAFAYYIAFWVRDGATPGKKVTGISVVEKDKLSPGIRFSTGTIRYIGYYLSGLPLGLGYFWMLWDRKAQCWHDKLAGTYVVKYRRFR